MHKSGLDKIKIGKENGSWTALDHVEKGVVPRIWCYDVYAAVVP